VTRIDGMEANVPTISGDGHRAGSGTPAPAVEAESGRGSCPQNPTQLERPAFLVNPPFSFSTAVPNNVWMEELDEVQRRPNPRRAMTQFLELYRLLASEALVYVLPTPRDCGLQDLVFTANLGVVLEHVEAKDVVVISDFTSPPRRGETPVGEQFFSAMGYRTYVSPQRFEGEAELKHLHDDVYIGGCGQRSDRRAYEWMSDLFDMTVIPVEHEDPYLYHLDCSVFPITREDTLVCTELYDGATVRQIERQTNIIDVSYDACFTGICNSVRLGNTIVNASHLHELRKGTSEYAEERAKNRRLEDIATDLAFEVNYVNLSEYHKGGALLSCMVMHLNRHSYSFTLL
jgi:N-dimethylarginine dimethylaminohydrolase